MSGGILKPGVVAFILDDKPALKVTCPGCGDWGLLDEDQARARVSTMCSTCGFHDSVDFLGDLTKCPRCEGQEHDRDNCALCLNVGWLDANGDALAR